MMDAAVETTTAAVPEATTPEPVAPEPADSRPSRPWRSALVAWGVYLVFAVALTWPLGSALSEAIPLGLEREATVPLFNLWTVWWNADRAAAGLADYWDAPIFAPTPRTFAMSEPQPTSIVVAPVVWVTGSRTLAYNVYLLLMLVLNAGLAFHLLRGLGTSWWLALGGGLLMERLPFVFWQLGVVQLVAISGVLATLHFLRRLGERPTLVGGIGLGASFGLTYWMCNYHGLFLSVLLLAAGWVLVLGKLHHWRTWAYGLLAVTIAACMLGPMVRVQREVSKQQDWASSRPLGLIEELSAKPADYLAAPWARVARPFAGIDPARRWTWTLGLGSIVTAAAGLGIVTGLCRRGRRLWTCFCVLFGLVAFLLSQGPPLEINGWRAYHVLLAHYPGFAQIRSPFRFGLFTQIAGTCLAMQGLELIDGSALWRGGKWLRSRFSRGERREASGRGRWSVAAYLLAWVPVTAVVALAVADVFPEKQTLYAMPDYDRERGWIEWLRAETEPESIVACLPFPDGHEAAAYEETTRWMYWGTFHRRRLVNGYSGFFTAESLELRDSMAGFPTLDTLGRFHRLRTDYLVVRRTVATREQMEATPELRLECAWQFGDEAAGVDIYRLTPRFTRRDAGTHRVLFVPGRDGMALDGTQSAALIRPAPKGNPSEPEADGESSLGPAPVSSPRGWREAGLTAGEGLPAS